jgi:hypothetical protein
MSGQKQRLSRGMYVALKIRIAGKLVGWPSFKANYKIHFLNGPAYFANSSNSTELWKKKRRNIL